MKIFDRFLHLAGQLPTPWIKGISSLQWKHPFLKQVFDGFVQQFQYKEGIIPKGIGKGLYFNTRGSNAGYLLGTSEPLTQAAFAILIKPKMAIYVFNVSNDWTRRGLN